MVFKRIYSSHCVNLDYLCCVFKSDLFPVHIQIILLSHQQNQSFWTDFLIQIKCFSFQQEWAFQKEWSLLWAYSLHFSWDSFHSLCWRAFIGLMDLVEIGSRTQKDKFSLFCPELLGLEKQHLLIFLGFTGSFPRSLGIVFVQERLLNSGSLKEEEGRKFSSLIDCKEGKVNRIHWVFVSPLSRGTNETTTFIGKEIECF